MEAKEKKGAKKKKTLSVHFIISLCRSEPNLTPRIPRMVPWERLPASLSPLPPLTTSRVFVYLLYTELRGLFSHHRQRVLVRVLNRERAPYDFLH